LCARLRTSISGRELTDQLSERQMAKQYPLFVEPEDLWPCLQKPVWAFSVQSTTSRPNFCMISFFFNTCLEINCRNTVEYDILVYKHTTRVWLCLQDCHVVCSHYPYFMPLQHFHDFIDILVHFIVQLFGIIIKL
jgi:hypothetical protein